MVIKRHKHMENKKLFVLRNIFAFYGAALMVIFLMYNLDGHVQRYNLLQKLLMIFLPLMTGSIFWNFKLYTYLNKSAFKNEKSFKKTYLNITKFLTGVILLFDLGMTYGIYLKFTGKV